MCISDKYASAVTKKNDVAFGIYWYCMLLIRLSCAEQVLEYVYTFIDFFPLPPIHHHHLCRLHVHWW